MKRKSEGKKGKKTRRREKAERKAKERKEKEAEHRSHAKRQQTKHTRKQTCKQLSQTGRHKRKNKAETHHRLAGNAQIPAREFQFASLKVQADSLSRISVLYFRSIWATKQFLGSARTSASDRNPLPYWHADNDIWKDNAGNSYFLRIRVQISTPGYRIRSIPMMAFLQVINHSPTHANMKGEGKGEGKWPTGLWMQDYLYNVHLVTRSPIFAQGW